MVRVSCRIELTSDDFPAFGRPTMASASGELTVDGWRFAAANPSGGGQMDGSNINHTTAICHLGGATLDNEENYLIKKLFTAGLGMVCLSNQARI